MRKHTCHLDLRQRSLYVTIGPKNWVQKLLDNQKEKFLDKQNSSNQPNQFQNQSVIDQGNLITNTKCLLIKAKHPGIERFKEKSSPWSREIKETSFHEELCSSDRSGQPNITLSVIKAQRNLSEEIRVEQTHDRSGQPGKHEIALRAAPEVYREIMTLNTDNELTRERIEEDMDFKIPGLPHSTVKQLQSSVRELIQKIENHPNRHALQRDLQQSQSFNPFSQESKQMIHEVGNIELCELLDMEPKTKCKVCLSYWDIGIVYCTCGHFLQEKEQRRIRNSFNTQWISFLFLTTRATPWAPLREEARGQRVLHRQFAQEEVQKEVLPGHPRPIHTRRRVPQEHD